MGTGSRLPKAAIRGKAAYMSPEAARGDALDARSDVFAAGIILWELLSGRRLYRAEEGEAPSLERAARAQIPALPDVGYPEQERLYAIVDTALAKERQDRFGSAREMRSALEAYVASTKLMASSLRFGEWLTTHFSQEILETRRAREILAKSGVPEPTPSPKPAQTPAELPGPPSLGGHDLEIPELLPPPASLAQYLPNAPLRAAPSRATLRTVFLVGAVLALVAFTVYLLR
jgi:serine/threonine-protein kinase